MHVSERMLPIFFSFASRCTRVASTSFSVSAILSVISFTFCVSSVESSPAFLFFPICTVILIV